MVTRIELDRFHDFAAQKIEKEGIESLASCLREWTEREDYDASVAAIQEAQAEVAAGQTIPVDQVEAEFRAEFNFGPRKTKVCPGTSK